MGAFGVTTAERPEVRAAARRQPVYIICSPRSRVGRTLVSRVLLEYALSDGRRALGFDINPDDRALTRHLPLNSLPGSIVDTRGQMALFDRLIVNDGATKVVDLAGDQFQAFFDVMHHVGFTPEARRRAIDTIVLFVLSDDRRSEAAYRKLLLRREQLTVVPVENPAAAAPPSPAVSLPHSLPALMVPPLPTLLGANVAERADFVFSDVLRKPALYPQDLGAWVGRMFLAVRDLELRLQLADFASLFRPAATAS